MSEDNRVPLPFKLYVNDSNLKLSHLLYLEHMPLDLSISKNKVYLFEVKAQVPTSRVTSRESIVYVIAESETGAIDQAFFYFKRNFPILTEIPVLSGMSKETATARKVPLMLRGLTSPPTGRSWSDKVIE